MVHLAEALVSPTSFSSLGEEDAEEKEEEASLILIFPQIVLLQKAAVLPRQFFQTVFFSLNFIFFFSFNIKAATDCLCWITNCSVLTTYLFVQSITNAAGGKCQRAHHIISARRLRPAERETCQLLTAGRTCRGAGMVKKKFLLSFLVASRQRIIQVAGTVLPSGGLEGGKELKKRTNKTKCHSCVLCFC